MYDLNKIKDCLNTKYIGQTIIQFDELKSTFAKSKNIFDTCPNGAVVLSENQFNCKIRFNRKWISMPDKNIYLSIILKPYHDNFSIPKFEAVTCACVQESIKNLCFTECQIKWPNDLFINNKKIASISCEEIKIKNKVEGIIISTSINVNDSHEESKNNQNINSKIEDNNNDINNEFYLELNEETDSVYNEFYDIKEIATSIKAETKINVDREQLISQILNNFEKYNDELINNNNIEKSINICNTYSLLNGKEISINKYKKKSFKKLLVKCIDLEGWLITTNEKGNEEIINSGEITVKYELQNN